MIARRLKAAVHAQIAMIVLGDANRRELERKILGAICIARTRKLPKKNLEIDSDGLAMKLLKAAIQAKR